jgi:hypothetical protein
MLISSPSCACGHHTPPGAALQGGLEDPAVKDRRRGLGPSPLGPGVEHPQGVAHGFKAPSSQPAPGLLIDRGPGREVVWRELPKGTVVDNPTQPLKIPPSRGYVEETTAL